MSNRVLVAADAKEAAEWCGAEILHSLEAARQARGIATLAVSGGSTPRIMFQWMASQGFSWDHVHLFWVDERCVPMDDAQSNYRMTRESLLDCISIPAEQVHRVKTELSPKDAAHAYVEEIRAVMGEAPVFDVLQRGMGADAHTASLFPGEELIADRDGIAASVWVEKMGQFRVTLLPGVLERARKTVNLVTGADKREALEQVLHGPVDYMAKPAMISSEEMLWYVDRAAT